jgi:hypothetical protein
MAAAARAREGGPSAAAQPGPPSAGRTHPASLPEPEPQVLGWPQDARGAWLAGRADDDGGGGGADGHRRLRRGLDALGAQGLHHAVGDGDPVVMVRGRGPHGQQVQTAAGLVRAARSRRT